MVCGRSFDRKLVPEVIRKLNSQLVGNVLNDSAAAHLSECAGELDVAIEFDVRALHAVGNFVVELRRSAIASLAIHARGLDTRRVCSGINGEDSGFPLEGGSDGSELDLDLTLIAGVTGLANKFQPGHASDDLRDVLKKIPDARDRVVDIERSFDVGHGVAAFLQGDGGAEPRGKG